MTSRPAKQHQTLFTFHRVREECEQGSADAWRVFLELYTPLAFQLIALYAPNGSDRNHTWDQTISALAENNFERFRATQRQSEREFLVDLRALLLDQLTPSRPAAEPAIQSTTPATTSQPADTASISPELESPEDLPAASTLAQKLPALLEGLPLLHQEMLFLRLAGYTDATIELMLRVAPRVAHDAFERLLPDYAAAQNLQTDRCPWPEDWLGMLQSARAAKTEKCPPLHQFVRIHDGQVSWYEKEPVEKHVVACLHCLEAWTALREVGYWRRVAPPVPPEQTHEFLRLIPAQAAAKKSILQRLFG
jgi:hypothetical protein